MPEARQKREISEPSEIPRSEEQKEQLIPALLMSVVEEVCSAMSARGAVIAVLDSQGIRCLASTGEAPPIGARLQPDSTFSAECFKTGKVVLRDEATGDSRIPLSIDGSVPVRSAVAVPILSGGSIIGTIEAFSSKPSATYVADIAPLEGIANFLEPIVALASGYAQPGTDGSTLGACQAEASSSTEIAATVLPFGRPKDADDPVNPLSPAVEPRPPASSPASQMESSAAEKSWQAVPALNVSAVQEVAALLAAQRTEMRTPPELILGDALANENTTEPDQPSTRNKKGILIRAVAAGFLVLAAGSVWYLRLHSSRAQSKLMVAVSQPPASMVASQSLPQDGAARRAAFPGDVTSASPAVTPARTSRQSAAAATQPISVKTVLPEYPSLARNQHVEGDVRVDAVIDENGRVTAPKAVSGPPLLQQAAVDALRQWRYRPATLDGKPVPMRLSVTIRFRVR
jgi:TonB family protein